MGGWERLTARSLAAWSALIVRNDTGELGGGGRKGGWVGGRTSRYFTVEKEEEEGGWVGELTARSLAAWSARMVRMTQVKWGEEEACCWRRWVSPVHFFSSGVKAQSIELMGEWVGGWVGE